MDQQVCKPIFAYDLGVECLGSTLPIDPVMMVFQNTGRDIGARSPTETHCLFVGGPARCGWKTALQGTQIANETPSKSDQANWGTHKSATRPPCQANYDLSAAKNLSASYSDLAAATGAAIERLREKG